MNLPPHAKQIPSSRHHIRPSAINSGARSVVTKLQKAGFNAQLVGGCVRDLLLGLKPKDFDVATDAHPEEVRALFRRSRLVGRRFRLAHVRMGREIIEVATYRANPTSKDAEQNSDGRLLRDNVYGTLEEDALRRDFTINALYYDPSRGTVIDFTKGMDDLETKTLRIIGPPENRYREDPVRMLRALRFAAKLGFSIEKKSSRPIPLLAHLLKDVPPARMFEEILKLFHGGKATKTYKKIYDYGVFGVLFPYTHRFVQKHPAGITAKLLLGGLKNTDLRVNQGKPVIPAFLFTILLWEPMRDRMKTLHSEGLAPLPACHMAAEEILAMQSGHTLIPRRAAVPIREIWELQLRFENPRLRRPARLLENRRFRAAYDFLLLRIEAGDADPAHGSWWTRLQEADLSQREQLIRERRGIQNKKTKRKNPGVSRNRRGEKSQHPERR